MRKGLRIYRVKYFKHPWVVIDHKNNKWTHVPTLESALSLFPRAIFKPSRAQIKPFVKCDHDKRVYQEHRKR